MVDLTVTLAGVALKNPIIPASGTFGYGREYAEVYDLDILGGLLLERYHCPGPPGQSPAPHRGSPLAVC